MTPDDHPVLTWIVRHAASLHSTYYVGLDGRTPWERMAGKMSEGRVAEFGERVMFITKGPGQERQGAIGVLLGRVAKI